LALDEGGESFANDGLLLGVDLLGEAQGGDPVLDVAAHVEGELRPRGAEEEVLRHVVLAEHHGDVAVDHAALGDRGELLDGHDDGDVLGALVGALGDGDLQVLEGRLA